MVISHLSAKPEVYVKRAEQAMQLENWKQAIRYWRIVLKKLKKQAPGKFFLRLAYCYRKQSMLDKSERVLEKGLKMHPDYLPLYTEYAEVPMAREDWESAIPRWQLATSKFVDQTPAEVWARLGRALRRSNKLNSSLEILLKGSNQYPDNPSLQIELAEVYTAQKNWLKALDQWKSILFKLDLTDQGMRLYVRLNISVIDRLNHIDKYRSQIQKYNKKKQTPAKIKIALVTSFTKGYDTLKPHEILDSRFDYVVYTNATNKNMGYYDIRPLPDPSLDGARASRYAKTHPHSLFSDYDVVVWIDTSLMIVDDIYPIIDSFMASDKPIGANVHPIRKTLQEEFEACIALRKGNIRELKRQMSFYDKIDFLGHGLAECGFLTFNLRDHQKVIASVMDTWWDMICRFSSRDQLSFTYALAQHNVEWYQLTKPPHGVRNHPAFVLTAHHAEYKPLNELIKLLG